MFSERHFSYLLALILFVTKRLMMLTALMTPIVHKEIKVLTLGVPPLCVGTVLSAVLKVLAVLTMALALALLLANSANRANT